MRIKLCDSAVIEDDMTSGGDTQEGFRFDVYTLSGRDVFHQTFVGGRVIELLCQGAFAFGCVYRRFNLFRVGVILACFVATITECLPAASELVFGDLHGKLPCVERFGRKVFHDDLSIEYRGVRGVVVSKGKQAASFVRCAQVGTFDGDQLPPVSLYDAHGKTQCLRLFIDAIACDDAVFLIDHNSPPGTEILETLADDTLVGVWV